MKLLKIGDTYHARYRAGKTRAGKPKWQTITTKCTIKKEAQAFVEAAGIPDIERAALAGNLTTEVVGRIAAGKKLTINGCIEPFREHLKACASSDLTIYTYGTVLNAWINFMGVGKLNPNTIEAPQINLWINNKGNKDGLESRKYKRSVIRAFYEFLTAKGWVTVNPAAHIQIDYDILSHEQKESKEKVPFTDAERAILVAGTDEPFWKFAIPCSYETGLRLSDIACLEWKSFAHGQGKLVVWTGKRNKRVEFDMSTQLSALIADLPVTDAKYVFPEQRAIIMDRTRRALLSMQFIRLAEKCGIEGKSFHNLRHTAASKTANDETAEILKLVEEIGIEKARKLLGHSSSKTTKGYVHT